MTEQTLEYIGEPSAIASLAKKLALVSGEVKNVPKSGFNQHFRYKFASEVDINNMINELLAKHGVAFMISINAVGIVSAGRGEAWQVDFSYMFTCSETGGILRGAWIAQAQDSGDKGINKAATAARKYIMKTVFGIPTGDEVDDPDYGHRTTQKEPKVKSKPEPSPAPDGVHAVVSSSQEIINGTACHRLILEGNLFAYLPNKATDDHAHLPELYEQILLGSVPKTVTVQGKLVTELNPTDYR